MNTIITEMIDGHEVATDVFQKLMDNRILVISSFIDDKISATLISTLMVLDAMSPQEKITLFLNVDGGDIRSCLALYDSMSLLTAPIETFITGNCVDGGILIAAAGTPGMRFISENSTISLCQIEADHMKLGNLVDAKTSLEQMKRDNERVLTILTRHTGKNKKELSQLLDRRSFHTAKDAVKLGLCDKVIKSKNKEVAV